MKLVMNPQQFDVVVTTNQFGDILTDEGAGIVGGLGLAPGLCVGERQAMAQATHGSAPDIAGRNIANPYAMIMSGQMLLEWLGRKRNEPKAAQAARLIDKAMDKVIAEAKHLTARSWRQGWHHADGRCDRCRHLKSKPRHREHREHEGRKNDEANHLQQHRSPVFRLVCFLFLSVFSVANEFYFSE